MAPKLSKAVSAPRCQYKPVGPTNVKATKSLQGLLKKPHGWDKVGEVGSAKLAEMMAKVDNFKKKALEEETIMLSFSPMLTYKYIGKSWVQVSGRKALLLQRAWFASVAWMICVRACQVIINSRQSLSTFTSIFRLVLLNICHVKVLQCSIVTIFCHAGNSSMFPR